MGPRPGAGGWQGRGAGRGPLEPPQSHAQPLRASVSSARKREQESILRAVQGLGCSMLHPWSWCVASTRDDWLPRLSKSGRPCGQGRGGQGAQLGGMLSRLRPGTGPKGWGTGSPSALWLPTLENIPGGMGEAGAGQGAGDGGAWVEPELVTGRPSRRPGRAERVGGRGRLGTLGAGQAWHRPPLQRREPLGSWGAPQSRGTDAPGTHWLAAPHPAPPAPPSC